MTHAVASKPHLWVFMLITLLSIISYYPGLTGDYMFDDLPNLVNNNRLDIESLSLETLQGASYSSGAGLLRRPVSMFSFALNRYFFGIEPFSYKLINLVIHLLTGLGLYILSRQLIRAIQRHSHQGQSSRTLFWFPLVVTGLWMVHPLNLTSVLYIVQRMASLATLFMVTGLCLYAYGRERMLSGKPGLPWILTSLFLCGGLAILSKENGALLPLYMMTLEIGLYRFRDSRGFMDKTIILFYMLAVAMPAALFLFYFITNYEVFLAGYNGRDFTLKERLLTESRVIVFYLKMIVSPSISELGLYHDDIALSRGLIYPPTTLYAIAFLLSLLVTAILLIRKLPLASLGILWFFASHVLESTIFPLEIAHEHRNYLAGYGIILAIACLIAAAPLRRLARGINVVVPLVFLALFSSTTWLRAEQWSDNVNHAIYEAMHHPGSHRAVYSAGRMHAALAINGHTESEEKAYAYLEKAADLDNTGIIPETALIKLSYLLDKPVKFVWFEKILYKLANYPIRADTILSLGALAKCIGDPCTIPHELMDEMFELALKSHNAELFSIYGFYLTNKRGDITNGLKMIARASEVDSKDPQGWTNLIEALTTLGRLDEAQERLAQFRETSTYGGNDHDYEKLQYLIDAKRREMSLSTESIDHAGE